MDILLLNLVPPSKKEVYIIGVVVFTAINKFIIRYEYGVIE